MGTCWRAPQSLQELVRSAWLPKRTDPNNYWTSKREAFALEA